MKNLPLRFILPLIIFLVVLVLFWRSLSLHPNEIPSALIGESIPTIDLPILFDEKDHLTNQDFLGQVTLFNVWASWCMACVDEHPVLLQLAQKEHLHLIGLDYKDDPRNARKWLRQKGNPYKIVALDFNGKSAIDWGVYGTPETFIIDKKGIIRYKQIGAITPDLWEKTLKPLVQQLQNDPT